MPSTDKERHDFSLLTGDDIFLFNEGSHFNLQDKLGSHIVHSGKEEGVQFSVWAPNAKKVSVIGDFNGWDKQSHLLRPREVSGIWEGFIPGVQKGDNYKYHIQSHSKGYRVDKCDPFAYYCEVPPKTASVVWDLDYAWNDQEWMDKRREYNNRESAMAVYEMHLGSWMRVIEENNRSLSYRELAHKLPKYLQETGFTHVEFLPIMEHPFFGSWGYQTTSYFAPTARYGTPQDLMYLIDQLHQHGIGVILDWVPSHFPTDEHSLGYFDGTHLFEHADSRQGFHPEWKSYIFNYGRTEVRSFLISSAMFWLEKYHVDGLRVDAVASMLYLDYARKDGEWISNQYGGKENIEAIDFLRRLNRVVYQGFPDVQTIAEESTSWPMVSRPTYVGGLGFGMKWDMGWMHDTLEYMSKDPIHRTFHHDNLTFRFLYAFHENFMLPLSHDEVVYGKGSLIRQMPGDDWQKFANLRLLFGYMYAQPGKKLLFMGGEFGQWDEWYHETSLAWHLLEYSPHSGLKQWVKDLNQLYKTEPCLHETDFEPSGFEWIDCNDSQQSTLSLLRKGKENGNYLAAACNFTPVPRHDFLLGVPKEGFWKEVLNSDSSLYGGSDLGNLGGVQAQSRPVHGRDYSIEIALPALAIVFFKLQN